MPKTYKFGLILTFLFRSFTLAEDFSKFHNEVNELKTIISTKKGYHKDFIDSCVKGFLSKLFIPRPSVCTMNKKEILLVLPYLCSFFRNKN